MRLLAVLENRGEREGLTGVGKGLVAPIKRKNSHGTSALHPMQPILIASTLVT